MRSFRSIFHARPLRTLLTVSFAAMALVIALIATEFIRSFEMRGLEKSVSQQTYQTSELLSLIVQDQAIHQHIEIEETLIPQISEKLPEVCGIDVLYKETQEHVTWRRTVGAHCERCLEHRFPIQTNLGDAEFLIIWDLSSYYTEMDAEILKIRIVIFSILALMLAAVLTFTHIIVLKPVSHIQGYFKQILRNRPLPDWKDSSNFWAKELRNLKKVIYKFDRLQNNLKEQQLKTKAIIDNSLDGILLIDRDGIIFDYNPAALKAFKYEGASLTGIKFDNFIHLKDLEPIGEEKHFLGLKVGQRRILQAIDHNGSLFHLDIVIEDVLTPYGSFFVAYFRDVSSDVETKVSLEQAKDLAQEANELKTKFIAMISHEMRTPLNGVSGVLGLLDETDLDEQQRMYVQTGLNSAEGLKAVINDVLDFSKIEVGKLELEECIFNIQTVVEDVCDIVRPSLISKEVPLHSYLSPTLPKWLKGDPGRIRQILLNLLSNAAKFTEKGVIEINVKSSVSKNNQVDVLFEVRDTGLGIAKDKFDRLFTEFTTIDASYARKFGGTGLGLSISKKLTDLMHGEIGVESEYGIGSNFWVKVPLLVSEDPEGKADDLSQFPVKRQLPATGTYRVLLVDDNSTNLLILKMMLLKMGHHVDMAGNGFEAIKAVKSFPYDLVFMDISMPEMDGLEATMKIRELEGGQDLPIIAATAHSYQDFAEKLHAADVDGYIRKPVQKEKMEQIMSYLSPQKLSSKGNVPKMTKPLTSETFRAFENLDIAVLRRLGEETDPNMIPELIDLFIEDASGRVSKIKDAAKDDNYKELATQAHTLSGSAAAYGAVKLTTLAKQLELSSKAHDAERITQQVKDIQLSFSSAMTDLREYKDAKAWQTH